MSGIESVNDLQSASCPTTLIDVLIISPNAHG
jgi:hypothetical protein